tara:strand:- start:427 stop:1242 length:816 start_codon:yes stop_codon:yes gene_type:complete
MITVEIMGGLGNQLFQVFTCLSYSMDYDIPFYIEDKTLEHGPRKKTYWDSFLIKLQPYLKKPINVKKIKLTQAEFKQIPKINLNQNYKLFGYFQSYKYFNNNKKKIIELLNMENIKNKLNNKYDYYDIVSLHFRLGDYKDLQQHHPILPIEYYIKSLKQLIEDTKKNDWKILYFYEKNDTEMILKNINILKNNFNKLTFIGVNHELEDYEQILCMSLCKHNIIANSTFSWWGAYFNNNDNLVYYPNIWFGPAQGNKKVDDLFLDDWKKIIV